MGGSLCEVGLSRRAFVAKHIRSRCVSPSIVSHPPARQSMCESGVWLAVHGGTGAHGVLVFVCVCVAALRAFGGVAACGAFSSSPFAIDEISLYQRGID